jgi:hypothetical protein
MAFCEINRFFQNRQYRKLETRYKLNKLIFAAAYHDPSSIKCRQAEGALVV